MGHLPWTKFQDFYLRLGFLKVLVAALSPQRRSSLNDAVVRRLESPLFDSAPEHPELWDRVRGRIDWYPRRTSAGKTIEFPETSEALLVDGSTASLLYGITRDTTYKVLDWGHDLKLVGRANQITERGLMLRHLLPEAPVEQFFSGNVVAWNPFVLTRAERLFFLYHLVEVDRVTIEIIDFLSELEPTSILQSSDAARITCRALFKVLNEAEDAVEPRDIPAYRKARELACTIAVELGLGEFEKTCKGSVRRKLPKPVKPSGRRNGLVRGRSGSNARRTTKNADHQTIPRFEQLVDLGFLHKVSDDMNGGDAALIEGRRRWRYSPTLACRRWVQAKAKTGVPRNPFQWHGFAKAAVAAFQLDIATQQADDTGSAENVAEYLWAAYEKVSRPMGNTPFDSVALHAMIMAVSNGVPLEMGDFHALMLSIKKTSALPHHAFFASGNDLDRMFIQLRPGFVEQVRLADKSDTLGAKS